MKKTAIVATVHIQPSEQWIQALVVASRVANIIIVYDSWKPEKVVLPDIFDVYDYERQREELGDKLFEMFKQFHKSSSCKNFGTWLAYQRGYDPIIVIDSDCVIPPDFIAKHTEALMKTGDGWANTIQGTNWYPRGFPHHLRKMDSWANMGLWCNSLDLYGQDIVDRLPEMPPTDPVQTGVRFAPYFPLSGMNVAFRRESIPHMLFLPNFSYGGYNMRRHDDIWGGYIFQKFAQQNGKVMSYGDPNVFHHTVVDAQADANEEFGMIECEKEFYKKVDEMFADGASSFEELALEKGNILEPLDNAFRFWTLVFQD